MQSVQFHPMANRNRYVVNADEAIRTAAKPRTGKVPKPPPPQLTSTQDVTRAPLPASSRMPPPPPPPPKLPTGPADSHTSEPSDHSRSPRPCKGPPQSLPHIVVGKPAAKTVMMALATTKTKAAAELGAKPNQAKAAAATKAGPVPMSTSSSTPTPSLLDQTLGNVVLQPRSLPLPLNMVRKILDDDSEEVEVNRICVDPFTTLTAWYQIPASFINH